MDENPYRSPEAEGRNLPYGNRKSFTLDDPYFTWPDLWIAIMVAAPVVCVLFYLGVDNFWLQVSIAPAIFFVALYRRQYFSRR